jgi:hypothetical protein
MKYILIKHVKSLLSLFFLCSFALLAQGQDKFSVNVRIGMFKMNHQTYVNVNNHEAYVLGNEVDLGSPPYLGLEINVPVYKAVSISIIGDFVFEHRLNYESLTNAHRVGGNPYTELTEHSFAPSFLSASLNYELPFFKKLTFSPLLGYSLRFTNYRGSEVISADRQVTTQIEEIMTAFQASFKKTNSYVRVGFSIAYEDFMLTMAMMQSFVENSNNQVEYLGTQHQTVVDNDYFSVGLGYRIW